MKDAVWGGRGEVRDVLILSGPFETRTAECFVYRVNTPDV